MLYSISWFLVLVLLSIWSMGVWVLHSFAAWSLTGIGRLVENSQPIEHWILPGWVALWLPSDLIVAIQAGTATVLPWVQSTLSEWPSSADWLHPLAWLLWGIGFVALLVGGVVLHALIAMTRKGIRA
jgi:hypothetical protein